MHLSDKLTASIEGRQSRDEIGQVGVFAGISTPRAATYNRFSPRIAASYKLTPDVMLYGVVSRGDAPGTFNTNASLSAAAPQFNNVKEEQITNYELGVKSTWLEGRLTANLTAYSMDWKDQQLFVAITYPNLAYSPTAPAGSVNAQQNITGQFTSNAGASKVNGFELEVAAKATEHLNLRGTLSYVDAKFKDFCSAAGLDSRSHAGPLSKLYRLQASRRQEAVPTAAADGLIFGRLRKAAQ